MTRPFLWFRDRPVPDDYRERLLTWLSEKYSPTNSVLHVPLDPDDIPGRCSAEQSPLPVARVVR